MKRTNLFAFAMGLSMMALQVNRGAATSICEAQCDQNYKRCQVVCSQNPCIISCDSQHEYCLSSCTN